MPVVSVIVPAHNAESTILKTIQSVRQQTFSDFELIVIDDGSTDKTLEQVSNIADERLKVFSYRNAGVSVARNRGIEHSTGEFIAFLDADDLWTADKLELQLNALKQQPEAGVAYSWVCFMDQAGKSFSNDQPIFCQGNVYPNLLVKNFLACGSIPLVRRQAIESVGQFNPMLTYGEDWEYWLRLASRWEFALVPKTQVFYRKSIDSASTNIELMERSSLNIHKQAFGAAPAELQVLKNQGLATIYEYIARLLLTHRPNVKGIQQAGEKLRTAIQLYPKSLLSRSTQRLLAKWLLMQLSPNILLDLIHQTFVAPGVQVFKPSQSIELKKSQD